MKTLNEDALTSIQGGDDQSAPQVGLPSPPTYDAFPGFLAPFSTWPNVDNHPFAD